jgi:hypothetical protein
MIVAGRRGGVLVCKPSPRQSSGKQKSAGLEDARVSRKMPEVASLRKDKKIRGGAPAFRFGEERWHGWEILWASDARQSFEERDGADSVNINLPKASGM